MTSRPRETREEHRRLLERWLYDGLTEGDEDCLPTALVERVRAHFRRLVDRAAAEVERGDVEDGAIAMARLRDRLEARRD